MTLADLELFAAYRYQQSQVDYLGPKGTLATIVLPDGSVEAVPPDELTALDT